MIAEQEPSGMPTRTARAPEEVRLLLKVAVFKFGLGAWALNALFLESFAQAMMVLLAIVIILASSTGIVAGLAKSAQAAARRRERAEAKAAAEAAAAAVVAARLEKARKFEEAKAESSAKFFGTVGQP